MLLFHESLILYGFAFLDFRLGCSSISALPVGLPDLIFDMGCCLLLALLGGLLFHRNPGAGPRNPKLHQTVLAVSPQAKPQTRRQLQPSMRAPSQGLFG